MYVPFVSSTSANSSRRAEFLMREAPHERQAARPRDPLLGWKAEGSRAKERLRPKGAREAREASQEDSPSCDAEASSWDPESQEKGHSQSLLEILEPCSGSLWFK